jgi:L-asparaginase
MYGGADGALIRSAASAGARGIVVQALGWGNVNLALYEAITDVIDAGIAVVIATRVPNGRVRPVYGFEGGGKTLQAQGAVFADDLSPQKARILLMLALQTQRSTAELQSLFDR